MDEKRKIKVYIAAGWFDKFQDEALTYIEGLLFNNDNFDVFSPRKEIKLEGKEGVDAQNSVFDLNCKHIKESDIVISSTVGKDMGTLWECGFSYANNKPIIYTFFDERFKDAKFNLMLAASGIACFTDKEEFETFVNELTLDNLNSKSVRWQGDFE